jgi:putative ABC transport system permease protein
MSTPDGERELELATIVDFPISGGAYFVLFDLPTAQTLYGKEGVVDTIDLHRASGVSTDEMIAAVEEILPPEAAVSTQEELVDQFTADFEQIITILRNVLLAFAGVALFVSLFIIYNTFAILVNQRLHQIGMLRALGATKGQIRTGVVVEAIVVGIAGSVIGMAFGLVVAFLIKSAFQASGGFPETNTVVLPRTIIVSLLVGVVATLVSALLPAFLAGRVSPVAAMRNEAPPRSSLTRRIVIGVVVLVVGLAMLALGLFGSDQEVATLLTELGAGAVLTFVGVAMLSVLFAGPIVSFVGRTPVLGTSLLALGVALPVLTFTVGEGVPDGVLGWITFVVKMLVSLLAVVTGGSILVTALRHGRHFGLGGSAAGLAGQLARQNAARAPQRTAATATALTIGIALVSTVGVVGESLKSSFADTLDRAVTADLFIYDQETFGSFSGSLADEVEALDGVAAVSRFRSNQMRIGEDVVAVAAYNATTSDEIIDFNVSDGSTSGLLDGGVMIYRDVATERDLSVGDTVSVEFPDLQAEELTVAGIFEDNAVLNTPWVIDIGLYEQHVTIDDDMFVGVALDEEADADQVKASVLALTAEIGSTTVEDNAEYLETAEGQVDQVITLINYMLSFALVVAFLGVINTIVLSVIERTREIGLLRAVGMSRRQVRATIRWESVIVCLFGALLGIALGVLFAWAAVTAIPDDIVASIAVPYESVLFAILLAALAGIVAAVLPARRAAKLDVLEAIATPGG